MPQTVFLSGCRPIPTAASGGDPRSGGVQPALARCLLRGLRDVLRLRLRRRSWILIAGIAIIVQRSGVGFGCDDRLDRCLELWDARFDDCRTLQMDVEGTAVHMRGSRLRPGDPDAAEVMIEVPPGGLPADDVSLPISATWKLDLAGHRFLADEYGHSFYLELGRFVPRVLFHRYGGDTLMSYYPPELNRDESHARLPGSHDIVYWTPDDVSVWIATRNDYPMLFSLGIFQLTVPLSDSLRLSRLKNLSVAGNARIDGAECIVVRTPITGLRNSQGYRIFYVDLAAAAAVRRYEEFRKGKKTVELSIQYDDSEPVPMPKGWQHFEFDVHGSDKALSSRYECVVTSLRRNAAIEDPIVPITLKPGMVVTDRRTRRKLDVQPDGTLTKHVVRPPGVRDGSRAQRRVIVIAVTAIAVASILAVWVFRMRGTRR